MPPGNIRRHKDVPHELGIYGLITILYNELTFHEERPHIPLRQQAKGLHFLEDLQSARCCFLTRRHGTNAKEMYR